MEPETAKLFQDLGISLILGLLVGLQREKTSPPPVAGMRTFALISVLGTLSAFLAHSENLASPWIVAAGFVGVAAVMVMGRLARQQQNDDDMGTTTEVAMLLMFAVGAYVALGPRVVAIAVGAGLAVLLQFKPQLHGFADRLGEKDMKAIMQFVLITCIILPILPHRVPLLPDTPLLNVLNPYETWLMVVLIVGISLGGYVLYKFLGRDAGLALGGLIGGAISSTATTVSYARRTKGEPDAAVLAAIVIMIASSIVYIRVLFEIAVVELTASPGVEGEITLGRLQLLPAAAGPLCIMMAAGLVPVAFLWWKVRREPSTMPEQGNPSEFKSAIIFGVLYAVVLFGLNAARMMQSAEQGMFAVAALSGLTDMDAISLSAARMVKVDQLSPDTGWRLLVIAVMSNLVFKTGLAASLGHRSLVKWIIGLFAVPFVAGGVLLLVWP